MGMVVKFQVVSGTKFAGAQKEQESLYLAARLVRPILAHLWHEINGRLGRIHEVFDHGL